MNSNPPLLMNWLRVCARSLLGDCYLYETFKDFRTKVKPRQGRQMILVKCVYIIMKGCLIVGDWTPSTESFDNEENMIFTNKVHDFHYTRNVVDVP